MENGESVLRVDITATDTLATVTQKVSRQLGIDNNLFKIELATKDGKKIDITDRGTAHKSSDLFFKKMTETKKNHGNIQSARIVWIGGDSSTEASDED